jgi:gliding motility-associated-like protein
MNSKKLLSIVLLIFLTTRVFSQGTLCSSATPFCTAIGTPFTYQNVTGTAVGQAGPDYGCLATQPRPSWFYIKSSAAGAMTFSLTQSTSPGGPPNIDVDFIAYGPYSTAAFPTACSNLTGGCAGDHNCAGNTEDCSYNPAATETMTLNPTAAGQYFIIMITNFTGTAGFITFTQTGGPSSDCSITCPNVISGDGFLTSSGANLPSSVSCGAGPITLMASNNSPFGSPIVPGIMLNFTTNFNNTNQLNWYENGTFLACFGPTCTAGPLATNTNNDIQLYYSSPTATTTIEFCETNTAEPNMGYSIMDLASGATIAFGTWVDDGSCQTVTLPPGAITGVATFTASCGSCVTSTNFGYGTFFPSLAGTGTHTITYSFSPGGSCPTYTFSKVITVNTPSITPAASSATICAGNSTTLSVTGTPSSTNATFSNFANYAIPDGSATGVSSPINITGLPGTVGTNLISVNLNIYSDINQDMDIFLVCPGGTTITLSDDNGGVGFDYTNTTFSTTGTAITAGASPFTGIFTPEQAFSGLSGCNMNGVWQLFVRDDTGNGLSGFILDWSITFTNQNNYTWAPSGSLSASTGTAVTASPTVTTIYTITATDASGCAATRTIAVNVDPKPTLTVTATNTLVCSGNTVSLTGSGASTYTWTGGITNGTAFSPTATTSYTLSGTSAAGCTNTAVQSVSVNTTPTVAISSVSSPVICSGNISTITPSGASSYTLINTGATGTSFTVNPTTTTTYSIRGVSASGCSSTNTITTTITVNTSPTVAISSVSSPVICSGNSSLISPSGASTYTLLNTGATGTSFNVSPTGTTTYSIVGASASSCPSTNTITTTISVNASPTVAISSVSSPIICSGNSSLITPSGASTYTLLNTGATGTSFNVSPTGTTTYSIVGLSASSCPSTNTITTTITVNTSPTVAISSVSNPVICSGNSSLITPSGASTYTLYPGAIVGTSFNVNPTSTTTYSVIGSSIANCPSTNTITTSITVNATPTVAISSVSSPVICSGNSSLITPSGASTYTLLNTGATGTSFNVSPTGTTTYSIVGASASSCPSTNTITTTISVNATPTVAIASVSSPSICNGNNTTITPSGATSYTLINTGATGTSFNVSPTGTTTYSIIGTSASACPSTNTITTTITVNAIPTSTASTTGSITCVTNTVSLNSTLAGMSYTWTAPGGSSITGSPNLQSAVGQGLGTYTLTILSPAGCTYSTTVAAIQNTTTPTSVNAGPTQTLICGVATVTLTGSATPGTATANWLGGVTSPTSFTTTTGSANTYTLQAINPATGCFITSTVQVISSIGSPSATANAVTNSITCTNSVVAIGITPSSAGPFTYQWTTPGISGATTNATANATLAGVYNVTLTNSPGNNCSIVLSITVPSNTTAVPASITPASTITCTTPSLTLNASPSGAYTYTWTGSSALVNGNTQNPTITNGGTYSVAITNTINGCVGNATVSVASNTVLPVVNIAAPSVTTTCLNPTVTIAASSTPSTGVTYSWTAPASGSLSNSTISNPVASGSGIFTVVVTNTVSGCSSSLTQNTVSVTSNTAIPTATLSTNALSITCTNPTVTTVASTTASPVSYNWSPTTGIVSGTQTTATPSFTAAGSYSVVVTNTTSGCASNASSNVVTVTLNNTIPTISLTSGVNNGTITCTNTLVTISPTVTPNANLTYTWLPSGVTSSTLTSATFTTSGIYTLAVTNTLTGCVTSLTNTANSFTVIANNTPPTFVLGTAPSVTATCAVPSVNLSGTSNADPNSVYTWTTPSSSTVTGNPISVSNPGIYTVAVTNTVNGCSSSSISQNTVEVVADAGIPVVTLSVNSLSITCSNPTPSVAVSTTASPVSYNWTPTSGIVAGTETTANPIFNTAGSYSVVVTNTVSGCATGIASNVVNVVLDNTTPTITLSSGANNGTITCTNTLVTITPTVTPSANLTYTWLPSGVTSSSLSSATFTAAGIYTLAVTNTLTGCITSLTNTANSFTVIADNAIPSFTLGTANSVTTTCAAPNATLSGSSSADPNAVYTWTTPSTSTVTGNPLIASAAGIYSVIVTNTVNGCSTSATTPATVEVIADAGIPNVTLSSNSVSITCSNPTPSVAVTTTASPVTYNWTPITGIVAGTETTANPVFNAAGSYSVVVTNTISGCATSITNNVVDVTLDNTIPSMTLSATGNNGTITCTNTLVTINPVVTPTANLTYTWSPSGVISTSINDATFTSAGVYTLVVTNTLTGCVSSLTNTANAYTVNVDNAVISATINTISTNTIINCGTGNSSVVLEGVSSATSPTYTWMPGSITTQTFAANASGDYTLSVIDANSGCSTSTVITVIGSTVTPQGVDAGTSANIACGSSTVTLNGVTTTSNTSFSWAGPSATSIVAGTETTANPIATEVGDYTLTVTDNLTGCINTDVVTVTQAIATASITANPTSGISPLDVAFTGAGAGNPNYSWNFGDGVNTSLSQNPNNTFTTGTYTVTLTTISGSCTATATVVIVVEDGLSLEIPNVFTPNNDGANDVFTIKSTGVKEISLQIFNRWGSKLYEFTGAKASWDGLAPNSSQVPEGTYFFFVKATGFDGQEIEKHGTVNLFR